MVLLFFPFVASFLGVIILQGNCATAQSQPPPCSVNCTITILSNAGCQLADIKSCLCTNEILQYELVVCVVSSCNRADQMIATQIFQDEICLGAPFPSRQAEIIRAEIILAVFTFPIVILRLISRVWIAHKLWWDDWMVILATVLMVPNTVIPIYTAYHGFGVHVWNVRVQDQIPSQQLYYVAQIFYALIQNIAKFSILFLYLRIFPTPQFRLAVKLSMVVIVCHTIAFTIGIGMQCLPVDSLWDLTIHGKCIDLNVFAISGAALSIFYDIVIMLLPISELKGLNLTLNKRIALCFMFALGSFACVTSMVRLKYLKDFKNTIDASWESTDVVLWSDIEICTAIICSCLMCIRPLLAKCFPALFASSNVSSTLKLNSKSVSSGLRSPWKVRGNRFSSRARSLGSANLSSMGGEGDEQMFVIQRPSVAESGGEGPSRAQDGLELEERGMTPTTSTTVGRERNVESSAEDLGVYHGGGER
ncbi:hypothetical protein BGZ57DRAFT_134326 [Hyaloscypha finlandica]|nr:hypothetical protein BGZ57DRAFT_134326 [Hyaloscypha finlandica]